MTKGGAFIPMLARRTALLAVFGLGGCVGALVGGGTGPREYRLTPKTTFPENLPKVSWSLAVSEPSADRTLDTNRIAIITEGIKVDYYADATWVDRAPALIQNLIVQSFVRSGGIATVGTDRDRLRSDFLLRPGLRAFQTRDEGGGVGPVRVALDVELLRLPRRDSVGNTSFSADSSPEAATLDAVVQAFDEAMGAVLKDVVVWTLRTGKAAPGI